MDKENTRGPGIGMALILALGHRDRWISVRSAWSHSLKDSLSKQSRNPLLPYQHHHCHHHKKEHTNKKTKCYIYKTEQYFSLQRNDQ